MIEAMKQWAEDVSKAYDVLAFGNTERALEILSNARTSLRQAIAEAAVAEQHKKQEPSGHFVDFAFADSIAQVHAYDQFTKGQAFYTNPQPKRRPLDYEWVGLSVFEINDLVENTEYEDYRDLVERTEAKLKAKNFATTGGLKEKNT